jgi:hypothetical protein
VRVRMRVCACACVSVKCVRATLLSVQHCCAVIHTWYRRLDDTAMYTPYAPLVVSTFCGVLGGDHPAEQAVDEWISGSVDQWQWISAGWHTGCHTHARTLAGCTGWHTGCHTHAAVDQMLVSLPGTRRSRTAMIELVNPTPSCGGWWPG